MLQDAHITGPVPPHVEAIRSRTGITLRYMAEFVEDPIFAIFGGLEQDDGSFAQAKDDIRAEFHSDVPDGFTPSAYACLQPLRVGDDNDENPAALGNSETRVA
eukprot:7847534-Pyramimonas_sp.AAC.1